MRSKPSVEQRSSWGSSCHSRFPRAALKEDRTFESVTRACGQSGVGEETGRTLAAALKENETLQSFTLNCGLNGMDEETGRALAERKENQTLQSLTLGLG